jgi:predicted  nucleic acid-binding Zn-ribbon protein
LPGELETLHKLQEVDERLLKRRREIEAMEKGLAERRAAMAACEARTQELVQRRKQLVTERAFAERKLAERQDLLRERRQRVGRLSNEKELRASDNEIGSLRQEISTDEDSLLQLMEQVETVEAAIEVAKKEYKNIVDQDHRQVSEEAGRIEALRAELEGITAERVAAANGINPVVLRRYDMVLQRRGGVAIVTVNNGTCGGCHMHVPPQDLIEIRRDSKVRVCANCQRILYVPIVHTPEV